MRKTKWLKKDQLKTVGVITMMIAGYALFVHLPGERRRGALRDEIRQAQQHLDQDRPPDLQSLKRRADDARARLDDERRPMPTGREVFRVLDGVSGALSAQGITDHQVTQGDPQPFADYTIQPISLEFQGGFTQAYAALKTLERMEHPVRVDRLELIGDEDAADGRVTAVVQLSAFFQEEAGDE